MQFTLTPLHRVYITALLQGELNLFTIKVIAFNHISLMWLNTIPLLPPAPLVLVRRNAWRKAKHSRRPGPTARVSKRAEDHTFVALNALQCSVAAVAAVAAIPRGPVWGILLLEEVPKGQVAVVGWRPHGRPSRRRATSSCGGRSETETEQQDVGRVRRAVK